MFPLEKILRKQNGIYKNLPNVAVLTAKVFSNYSWKANKPVMLFLLNSQKYIWHYQIFDIK